MAEKKQTDKPLAGQAWMQKAIALAKNGTGYTNPNPLVGAVIVKDGVCVGSGWHERYGQLHAERNALADCRRRGNDPAGATMYVTLEPCCHHGNTPPCTEAIIENKLAKVVIGSRDPNPLVSGKGVRILEEAGITVVTDFLREDCDALNPVFFHYITTGMPYVVLKYAMTMDGKIAAYTGKSQWITGPAAREQVHRDRHRLTGIMVGIGTVLADDPMLTCRLPDGGQGSGTSASPDGGQGPSPSGKNPVRIICDTHLRTPLSARVVTTTDQARTILATACADPQRHRPYLDTGCEILVTDLSADGHLDLTDLMKKLAAQKIDSILLEGGSTLNWAALSAGIVQRVQTYIAPKLFGGASAPSPIGGQGVPLPDAAFMLNPVRITTIGEDLCIESEIKSGEIKSSEINRK